MEKAGREACLFLAPPGLVASPRASASSTRAIGLQRDAHRAVSSHCSNGNAVGAGDEREANRSGRAARPATAESADRAASRTGCATCER
jgi:hypothetical protein